MRLALDATMALAWALDDERDDEAVLAAQLVSKHGATVIPLWALEVQNALLLAVRRKRLDMELADSIREEFGALAIMVDTGGPLFSSAYGLAKHFNLTVYDAAYLELAQRRALRLMTKDARLSAAADALSLRWVPDTDQSPKVIPEN